MPWAYASSTDAELELLSLFVKPPAIFFVDRYGVALDEGIEKAHQRLSIECFKLYEI
jgi:hypothetical protein